MSKTKHAVLFALAALGAAASACARTTVVTFDNGDDGWTGDMAVVPTGGNPDANAHFLMEEALAFGVATSTHPAFVGDLTQDAAVTIGVDAIAHSIDFAGSQVPRRVIVEFRSRALAQNDFPYASVWYDLGAIQAGPSWSTYSVTVAPNSSTLPAGWGGDGDNDPDTGRPRLPPGVTFADVMATVDEVAISTAEPGRAYAFVQVDARFDNIRIERTRGDAVFADGFELAAP